MERLFWEASCLCRKGRCQETQKGVERQHPRNHQASNQETGSSWRCQAYLWLDLWGDQKRPQGLPGERDQGCSHLHWARSPQDSDSIWCCLCPQETGQDSVRIWRINSFTPPKQHLVILITTNMSCCIIFTDKSLDDHQHSCIFAWPDSDWRPICTTSISQAWQVCSKWHSDCNIEVQYYTAGAAD